MAVSSPARDARQVSRLFSRIAPVYDLFNRLFSLGLDSYWRKRLAATALPEGGAGSPVVLDLAAGTLEVTLELARRNPDASFVAADFCRPMLLRGAEKLKKKPETACRLLVGDARCLPLPDCSVDVITLAFGLRNMQPRQDALKEAMRVLRPGGRLCVLEFSSAQDRILFGVYNMYLAYVLPAAGRLLSKDKQAYQHLADSILEFPSAEDLAGEMRGAGFSGVDYEQLTFGIVSLHTGRKHAI